ncbi:MAG: hypothetical protein Kow0047_30810 [Anaerolineae bacterium]
MPRPLSVLEDLAGPLELKQEERLYKIFLFRAQDGSGNFLEHRVLAKERSDGRLEMISYAIVITADGQMMRSHTLRVRELSSQMLELAIDQILQQAGLSPEDFEEIDLTGFERLDQQIEHLRDLGLIDDQ